MTIFGSVTTEMTSLFTNFFLIIPAGSKCQIRWICGQLNSRGPHPSFERESKIHRFIHNVLPKTLHEGIRVVVQCRQRNVPKSVMHVQSCCFA